MAIIGSPRGWAALNVRNRKRKAPKQMRCYRVRNENLADAGYETYRDYLAGDEWKRIRGERLAAYPKCFLCGVKAAQVHHLSYDHATLLGLRPHNLMSLCDTCHVGIEYDGGRKLTLRQANKKLFLLIRAMSGGPQWLIWHECEKEKAKRRQKQLAAARAMHGKKTKAERRKEKVSVACACGNLAAKGYKKCRACRRKAKAIRVAATAGTPRQTDHASFAGHATPTVLFAGNTSLRASLVGGV